MKNSQLKIAGLICRRCCLTCKPSISGIALDRTAQSFRRFDSFLFNSINLVPPADQRGINGTRKAKHSSVMIKDPKLSASSSSAEATLDDAHELYSFLTSEPVPTLAEFQLNLENIIQPSAAFRRLDPNAQNQLSSVFADRLEACLEHTEKSLAPSGDHQSGIGSDATVFLLSIWNRLGIGPPSIEFQHRIQRFIVANCSLTALRRCRLQILTEAESGAITISEEMLFRLSTTVSSSKRSGEFMTRMIPFMNEKLYNGTQMNTFLALCIRNADSRSKWLVETLSRIPPDDYDNILRRLPTIFGTLQVRKAAGPLPMLHRLAYFRRAGVIDDHDLTDILKHRFCKTWYHHYAESLNRIGIPNFGLLFIQQFASFLRVRPPELTDIFREYDARPFAKVFGMFLAFSEYGVPWTKWSLLQEKLSERSLIQTVVGAKLIEAILIQAVVLRNEPEHKCVDIFLEDVLIKLPENTDLYQRYPRLMSLMIEHFGMSFVPFEILQAFQQQQQKQAGTSSTNRRSHSSDQINPKEKKSSFLSADDGALIENDDKLDLFKVGQRQDTRQDSLPPSQRGKDPSHATTSTTKTISILSRSLRKTSYSPPSPISSHRILNESSDESIISANEISSQLSHGGRNLTDNSCDDSDDIVLLAGDERSNLSVTEMSHQRKEEGEILDEAPPRNRYCHPTKLIRNHIAPFVNVNDAFVNDGYYQQEGQCRSVGIANVPKYVLTSEDYFRDVGGALNFRDLMPRAKLYHFYHHSTTDSQTEK